MITFVMEGYNAQIDCKTVASWNCGEYTIDEIDEDEVPILDLNQIEHGFFLILELSKTEKFITFSGLINLITVFEQYQLRNLLVNFSDFVYIYENPWREKDKDISQILLESHNFTFWHVPSGKWEIKKVNIFPYTFGLIFDHIIYKYI